MRTSWKTRPRDRHVLHARARPSKPAFLAAYKLFLPYFPVRIQSNRFTPFRYEIGNSLNLSPLRDQIRRAAAWCIATLAR